MLMNALWKALIATFLLAGAFFSLAHAVLTIYPPARPAAVSPTPHPTPDAAGWAVYPLQYVVKPGVFPDCNEEARTLYIWFKAGDGVKSSDDLLFCRKDNNGEYRWHYVPMVPVVERTLPKK